MKYNLTIRSQGLLETKSFTTKFERMLWVAENNPKVIDWVDLTEAPQDDLAEVLSNILKPKQKANEVIVPMMNVVREYNQSQFGAQLNTDDVEGIQTLVQGATQLDFVSSADNDRIILKKLADPNATAMGMDGAGGDESDGGRTEHEEFERQAGQLAQSNLRN